MTLRIRIAFGPGGPFSPSFGKCGGAYSPFRARLVPAEPGEEGQAPGRGEEHVCGGGAGEAEDEDRGGDHEGGIEAGGVADAADGEEGSEDQEGGGDGRRDAGGPVGDAEDGVGEHFSPVEKDGFFQPGVVVEDGDNPVVAGKHFTGNLGVAGLVGANQSDAGEAEEEEKAAEAGEQEKLAKAGLAARHGEQCMACGRIRQSGRNLRRYRGGTNESIEGSNSEQLWRMLLHVF